MPTYVYRREDGSTFEIEQRITEDALTTCPTTGQSVRRVISGGTGLIFKGSGFYLTDYARSGSSPPDGAAPEKSASAKTSDTAPAPDKGASKKDKAGPTAPSKGETD